tara:strand:+ start:27 stop:1301 length:1275 start_codon:yes stop_codon:yes gene_type:complete
MYQWMKDLFPLCRSITGEGTRETLKYFRKILPRLNIHEVPSGVQAFDWVVPDEWTIRDAFIKDESGKKIIDFQKNNLHLMGYSEPINEWMNLEQLNEFLFSIPEQPLAIPYITSYYKKRWGFCLSYEQHQALKEGNYHVFIDSEIKPGVMNYGEIIIPGKSSKEIFLSTYVCHPSMANNELSGPIVTTALAHWLSSLKDLEYTYRIIYVPETIGSILYLSKNFEHLKKNVIAGFNITCIGDERCYSYLPSRDGDALSDRVAKHVLKHIDSNYLSYKWTDRGSDERQYCAPGIDLPIATIMRSKYGEYPEYHTSLDNLDLVSVQGLEGGLHAIKSAISVIEENKFYISTELCEPQLGKRGLYPTISTKNSHKQVETMMNILTYCDGTISLLEIAEIIDKPLWELIPVIEKLLDFKLVSKCDRNSI